MSDSFRIRTAEQQEAGDAPALASHGDSGPSPDTRNTRPGIVSGSDPVAALRVVCGWCRKVIRDGAEPTSHGICPGCADKLSGNIRERAARRLLAELYQTHAAILVLLPFLKGQCDLGWPGQDGHLRTDYTNALADLRAAVGDA